MKQAYGRLLLELLRCILHGDVLHLTVEGHGSIERSRVDGTRGGARAGEIEDAVIRHAGLDVHALNRLLVGCKEGHALCIRTHHRIFLPNHARLNSVGLGHGRFGSGLPLASARGVGGGVLAGSLSRRVGRHSYVVDLVLRRTGGEGGIIICGLGVLAHLKAAGAVGEVVHVGVAVEGAVEGRVGVHVVGELVGGVEHGVVPVHAVTQRGVLRVHGRGRGMNGSVRGGGGAGSEQ